MGEFMKPIVPQGTTHGLSDDERDSSAFKYSVSDGSEERKRSVEIDEHSEPARTDAAAWDGYFSHQMAGIFTLFKDQAMYNQYIRSERKALDAAIMQEREDARMHERWERLRESFHDAFMSVLDEGEREKAELRKTTAAKAPEDVVAPVLPFEGIWITDPDGMAIRVARIYVRTEPTVPRLRLRISRVDPMVKNEPFLIDYAGDQHSIQWLRLRRQPHPSQDEQKAA